MEEVTKLIAQAEAAEKRGAHVEADAFMREAAIWPKRRRRNFLKEWMDLVDARIETTNPDVYTEIESPAPATEPDTSMPIESLPFEIIKPKKSTKPKKPKDTGMSWWQSARERGSNATKGISRFVGWNTLRGLEADGPYSDLWAQIKFEHINFAGAPQKMPDLYIPQDALAKIQRQTRGLGKAAGFPNVTYVQDLARQLHEEQQAAAAGDTQLAKLQRKYLSLIREVFALDARAKKPFPLARINKYIAKPVKTFEALYGARGVGLPQSSMASIQPVLAAAIKNIKEFCKAYDEALEIYNQLKDDDGSDPTLTESLETGYAEACRKYDRAGKEVIASGGAVKNGIMPVIIELVKQAFPDSPTTPPPTNPMDITIPIRSYLQSLEAEYQQLYDREFLAISQQLNAKIDQLEDLEPRIAELKEQEAKRFGNSIDYQQIFDPDHSSSGLIRLTGAKGTLSGQVDVDLTEHGGITIPFSFFANTTGNKPVPKPDPTLVEFYRVYEANFKKFYNLPLEVAFAKVRDANPNYGR
jgi:hypothetical protein